MKKLVLTLGLVSLVKLANAQNFFTPAVSYSISNNSFGVITADFNGDGKADIATANLNSSDVSILLNTGSGAFAPAINYTVTGQPWGLTAADYNGDGKIDIATGSTNGDNTISILLNTGAGVFAPSVTYAAGAAIQRLTSADFDGDGKIDIAVVNQSTNSISVLLNAGAGTFPIATSYPVGSTPNDIVAADFDGDGKLDLAVVNAAPDNTISILSNAGAGTFTTQGTYPAGAVNPTSLVVADFDGDSKIDIATANFNNNNISILLNTAGFAVATTYTVGNSSYDLVATDINNDGNIDIATADYNNNTVSVLLNLGSSIYSVQATTYTVDTGPVDIVAGDFNGDGKVDLVTANCGVTDVSVLNSPLPGAALNFDGVDDYAVASNNAAMGIGNTNFSIEVDFQSSIASQPDFAGLVSKGTQSGWTGVQLVVVNNHIAAEITDGSNFYGTPSGLEGTSNICDGSWHHLAITVDFVNGVINLYVDGVAEATVTDPAISTMDISNTADLIVGAERQGSIHVNGNLDEVRIWNHALCSGEIMNNMNAEIKLPNSGLNAYYKFNEGIASDDNTAMLSAVVDSSGNFLIAAMQNFALNGSTSNFIAPGAVTTGSYAATFVNPSVTITGNNLICLGASTSTTLTASGTSTYVWSSNANSATTASVSITPNSSDTYTVTGTTNGCTANAVVTVTVSSMPTVTVSANPIYVCSGGNSQLLVVDDGSQTLNYVWSPATFLDNANISNPLASAITASTNYSVAISNTAGCTVTDTISIYSGINLNASTSITSATICAGTNDTLHVTPTGGGSPYTYAWTGPNSFTSTDQDVALTSVTMPQAGTYTVEVTDNCAAQATSIITLVVNPLPAILTASGNSHTCEGGTAVYNITSNNPTTDTYQWNWVNVSVPSVDSVVLGLYSESGYTTNSMTISPVTNAVWGNPSGTWGVHCAVTNTAGCTAESVIDTLFINPIPTLTITATSLIICQGKNDTLTASGATSYTWSPGTHTVTQYTIHPNNSTTYTLTGVDVNGCVNTATQLITVNPRPTLTVTPTTQTVCAGSSADISTTTTSTNVVSYMWSNSATTASITVTPTITATYNYTVTAIDANGCSRARTAKVIVQTCSGIENYTASTNNLQVYPNPFSNQLTIVSTVKTNALLFDMLGNKINEFILQDATQTISVDGLAPGMYYLQVDAQKIKIIKQ